MSQSWVKWPAFFFFLLAPAIAGGASFIQVGVGSDFVIRQDRLYFAQWDGSLTALDIESGEPVLRARGDFWGSLRDVPEGLLVLGYSGWRLLDWDTLHELQGKDRVYSSQYRNGIVVYDDGYGHFTARRLQTDEVLWTFSHPGAVSLRIDGEHVLLHCSGRYGYGTPVIVLLDLFTGEEVFRKTPDAGVHHLDAFLHDGQVIVFEGAYHPQTQERAMALLQRKLRLSTTGERIAVNESLPEALSERRRFLPDFFHWDDLWFYDDGGTKWVTSVPFTGWNRGPLYEAYDWGHTVEDRVLVSGNLAVTSRYLVCFDPKGDTWPSERKERHLLQVQSPERTQFLLLPAQRVNPYSTGDALSAVASRDNSLFIGTNYGHVESIDWETGASNWVYRFSTNRPMVSYSRRAGFSIEPPFPYYRDRARAFREGKQPIEDPGYFIPLDTDIYPHSPDAGRYLWSLITNPPDPSPGRIHHDPDPTDPFAHLWVRHLLAWCALVAVFGGMLAVVLAQARSRMTWRAAGWIVHGLMITLFISFPFLIFIEPITSRSLFVALFLLALFALITVAGNYWKRNWITATAGLLVLGAITATIFLPL